ncbi:sugar O-acetyltransferase [Candidatus Proelusimicrobium volucris]|uniref:sugar O-acetyltransferase n=1 Tax=Candidatus Proelusimicrobium volucris TaxID=3416225 RepID=UPI003D0CFFCC
MTEKEKMISGLDYLACDKQLKAERIKAKNLCLAYNALPAEDFKSKEALLRRLFGKIAGNVIIEPNFFCDYGYNIEFTDNAYINHNCVILDCAKVTIGANVMIGPNCGIYTATHPIEAKARISALESAKPILIEDNVWLGGNVTILPGVRIGRNSVIGAGAVVNRDVPANSLAVGNPCKIIRKINND